MGLCNLKTNSNKLLNSTTKSALLRAVKGISILPVAQVKIHEVIPLCPSLLFATSESLAINAPSSFRSKAKESLCFDVQEPWCSTTILIPRTLIYLSPFPTTIPLTDQLQPHWPPWCSLNTLGCPHLQVFALFVSSARNMSSPTFFHSPDVSMGCALTPFMTTEISLLIEPFLDPPYLKWTPWPQNSLPSNPFCFTFL